MRRPFVDAARGMLAECSVHLDRADVGLCQGNARPRRHGGVGSFAVQLAKILGAGEVTAVCSTRNVEAAARLGADRVVDYTVEDPTAEGRTYDVVLDNAGVWPLRASRRVVAEGGVYVLVTAPKSRWLHPLPRMIATPAYFRLTGGRAPGFKVARRDPDDIGKLRDLVEEGRLHPEMDRVWSLDQAPEAVRVQGEFHSRGKSVVIP